MKNFDCFNGDADGICALIQLRLDTPLEAQLITGVKRDTKLLSRVEASAGDNVTVLDISLDKNRELLGAILEAGATVFYCDHHFAGDIPEDDNLTTLINTTPDVCTSLLINQKVKGAFLEWALVGTFGDNLHKSATAMAKSLNLNETDLTRLKNLGVYFNYNGYGRNLDDLYYHPADLYKKAVQFKSPFDFMANDAETYNTLEQGYLDDMAKAKGVKPANSEAHAAVFMLPNEPWARRVSGVFSNDLVNGTPERAHAVITDLGNDVYIVSVRAPLNNKTGADEICRQFDTGGGRKAAAGINLLPKVELDKFIAMFSEFYR